MDILNLYRDNGAYLEGHFLLASGRHSPKFLQSTTVTQYPRHNLAIGKALAKHFEDVEHDFIIGPAMGGVTLAFSVANALGSRALFAEKDGHGGMFVRDAFNIQNGAHFIAIEDVMTTGGSLKKTIKATEARGGVCVGVGCIIDRGLSDFFGVLAPKSLTVLDFPTYSPEECPLCQQGIILEEV